MNYSERREARIAAAYEKQTANPSKPKVPPAEECAEDEEEEKMDTVTKEEHDKAVAKAATESSRQASEQVAARFNAVLGSDNYAGREAFAAKLLKNDKLSAEEINDILADVPTAVKAENDDSAARAKVLATIEASQPIDPGSGGQSSGGQQAQNDDVLITNMKARFSLAK